MEELVVEEESALEQKEQQIAYRLNPKLRPKK
jgi:hypothetical protein